MKLILNFIFCLLWKEVGSENWKAHWMLNHGHLIIVFFSLSQGKSKYLPSCFYEKKFSLVYLHVWFFLARRIICLLLVQHEIEPIDHRINWMKHAQLYVVQGRRNILGLEDWSPPNFSRYINPISILFRIYSFIHKTFY